MKHKTRTKALSWLFSFAMVLSLLPGLSSTAKATAAEDATWSENQNITADAHIGKLTVTADVTVTIDEDKTVTVYSGVDATGHTLTVTGKGSLVVYGPGITEEWQQQPDPCIKGNLTVDSGTVEVTGGTGGIMGGVGIVGHLIVNSGTVTVTGGSGTIAGGNGIEGTYNDYAGYTSSITVSGGTVTVNGGSGSIVSGNGVNLAEVTVRGGSLTVTGVDGTNGSNGAESAKITVSGGSFTAIGGNASGEDSTAIGGIGVSGDVIVSGGSFTATGGFGQTAGQAVYEHAKITCENGAVAEESDDGSTWTVIAGDSSAKRYVRVTTPSTYTLTIPSTLTVANSGWNATAGISATGYLADGKKLTVTASSGDEFALVNQSDSTKKVGYKLATTSTDTEATTSWEFTELSSTATKKDMGIIVEDYSSMPAGTYTDTVTFTAKVKDSATDLSTLTAGEYVAKDGDILTGTLGANVKISIADGATVTLKDVNITNPRQNCLAGINCSGDAILILEGTNTVYAGNDGEDSNHYPGIWILPEKTLTIDGDGSLTAYCTGTDPFGAGIGGGFGVPCGNIVINGGTITARGSTFSAGIGGGYFGACGNITIKNTVTKVTATAGSNSPNSIGAGKDATCGTVTIGGTVYWDGTSYQNGGDSDTTGLMQTTYTYQPS